MKTLILSRRLLCMITVFMLNKHCLSLSLSLKFVPKGPMNNIPTLVQIMAWRRPGDKPLSEPMMDNLLTHICVTRPQWVNKCLCYTTVPVALLETTTLQPLLTIPVIKNIRQDKSYCSCYHFIVNQSILINNVKSQPHIHCAVPSLHHNKAKSIKKMEIL